MTELLTPPELSSLDSPRDLGAAATLESPDRDRTGNLSLGLDLSALGVAPYSWAASPEEPGGELDQRRVAELVRLAQDATLDFVAFDEAFALVPGVARTAASRLDAARVACRLASVTSGIGLVATLDTSYLDPVHVATALSTLNEKSGGRAAWQVGTAQARLLGDTEQVWRRLGREVETVVPGARGTGRSGRPAVVVRAASPASTAFAGAHADVVRIEATDAEQARVLRDEVRTAAAEAGRDPGEVRVLVDAVVLVGPDAASARARLDILGDLAQGEPPWRRTLSHLGNAEQLAELIHAWYANRVADGFTLIPGSLPHDARALASEVVPLLRERELVRESYRD